MQHQHTSHVYMGYKSQQIQRLYLLLKESAMLLAALKLVYDPTYEHKSLYPWFCVKMNAIFTTKTPSWWVSPDAQEKQLTCHNRSRPKLALQLACITENAMDIQSNFI